MKSRNGDGKGPGGRDRVKVVMAKTTSRAVGGHGMDVRHVPGVGGGEKGGG